MLRGAQRGLEHIVHHAADGTIYPVLALIIDDNSTDGKPFWGRSDVHGGHNLPLSYIDHAGTI